MVLLQKQIQITNAKHFFLISGQVIIIKLQGVSKKDYSCDIPGKLKLAPRLCKLDACINGLVPYYI